MLAMTGCSQSSGVIPLEEIPDTYSLEQAKEDGCVTHENGDVTQGKEEFEEFFDNTLAGKTDEIRLAFYDTLKESNHRGLKDYESVQDDVPLLSIQDLSFNGEEYTVRWYENGEEIIRSYAYLMKFNEQVEGPNGTVQTEVIYVLTHDNSVTWQEILHGNVSSKYGAFIDHLTVCIDVC